MIVWGHMWVKVWFSEHSFWEHLNLHWIHPVLYPLCWINTQAHVWDAPCPWQGEEHLQGDRLKSWASTKEQSFVRQQPFCRDIDEWFGKGTKQRTIETRAKGQKRGSSCEGERCSLTMKQNVLARAEADSWLLGKVMSGQEVNSSLFVFFSYVFFFPCLWFCWLFCCCLRGGRSFCF